MSGWPSGGASPSPLPSTRMCISRADETRRRVSVEGCFPKKRELPRRARERAKPFTNNFSRVQRALSLLMFPKSNTFLCTTRLKVAPQPAKGRELGRAGSSGALGARMPAHTTLLTPAKLKKHRHLCLTGFLQGRACSLHLKRKLVFKASGPRDFLCVPSRAWQLGP